MKRSLNLQYIVKNGILDELARVFNNLSNSQILLAAAGFPGALMPAFDTALDFWSDVCRQIDQGVTEEGFEPLLSAAAQRFPGNRVFRRHAQEASPVQPIEQTPLSQPAPSVNLVISGWEDPLALLKEARQQAQNQGRDSNSITLGFSNVEGVLLNLMGWTMDQAIALQKALEVAAADNNLEVDTNIGTSEFKDYLLSRLFVEGPDQARYEINDVRASTPAGEIAKTVMGTFYGKGGRHREIVVDKQNEDGSTERLNPNKTLHEQNVQEGDSISIVPESRAGCFLPGTEILLVDGNSIPIEQLKIGDQVFSLDTENNIKTISRVKKVIKQIEEIYLEVNGQLKITPKHLVYTNQDWIPIGQMREGDYLRTENDWIEIEQIKSIKETNTVYNLVLESGDQNFFADGILVHNHASKIVSPLVEVHQGSIDLSQAGLSDLEFIIFSCAPLNFDTLVLDNNSIGEIPDSITKLKQIKHLSLKNNKLASLNPKLFELTGLETLDLRNNFINQLPDEIRKLKGLKYLYLDNNLFEDLNHNCFLLKELKELGCSNNQIALIHDSIQGLENIEKLNLANNLLKELPREFYLLTKVKELDLSKNNIVELSQDISRLKNLVSLQIDKNRINVLPKEIGKLVHLKELNIDKNPLGNIPKEILTQGKNAIINYFQSLNTSEEIDYLYEAKLIIVGKGSVGKTSLVKKLKDIHYKLEDQAESTKGIDISEWKIPVKLEKNDSFRFNIWDFGGQDKYQATHQFFITERSLYLFVTESTIESNYLDFDYWLNLINIYSNESPVIVIQNKIDKRSQSLPTQLYKNQYENILRFTNTSCASEFEYTIKELTKFIGEGIKELPQVGDKLPKAWVEVRRILEDDKRDYISYDDYLTICAKRGLSENEADYLSQYFHDLGIIVHYQRDQVLKQTVIINPDWAVDGVYNVLDTPKIQKQQGVFTNDDLVEIWSERKYKKNHSELLSLMKNYELCFELKKRNKIQYIAPELLPADPPKDLPPFVEFGNLHLEFKYEFMPKGIITRFIIKTHNMIYKNIMWKYGVRLIYEDDTFAEVTEDYVEKKIRIRIYGPFSNDLLAIIRKELKDIHQDFYNLPFDEMLPCVCNVCRSASKPYFFKFKRMKQHQEKKLLQVICELSEEVVNVNSVINNVRRTQNVSAPTPTIKKHKPIKTYISYVDSEKPSKIEIVKQLSVLRKQNLIELWSDDDISPGENEKEVIRKKLEQTGLVLLLVSAYYLDKYLNSQNELILGGQKLSEFKGRVVPILIKPCLWRETSLFHQKVLPTERSFVSEWESKAAAYQDIAYGVKNVIDHMNRSSK